MEPNTPVVKIAKGEIEHILNLKASFDHYGDLLNHADKYLNLGWALVALAVEPGKDLDLDSGNLDLLKKTLENPGPDATKINLGVYPGSRSGLLVLEVATPEERSRLDKWGDWRSRCVAELPGGLEKHFYRLSPGLQPLTTESPFGAEGAATLLPPSLDPVTQERWQWRNPPWDDAPAPLPSAIWNYLDSLQITAKGPDLEEQPRISWRELYCLISPFEPVLQAFTQRAEGGADYYERILQVAVEAGLTDPEVLLALLWHAPRGDARQRPGGRAYLQNLVSRVAPKTGTPGLKFLQAFRAKHRAPEQPPDSPEKVRAGRTPISRRILKHR